MTLFDAYRLTPPGTVADLPLADVDPTSATSQGDR
jgi:hypothetical protein